MMHRFIPATVVVVTQAFSLTGLTGCERGASEEVAGHLGRGELRLVFIGPAADDPQNAGVLGGARRYAAKVPYVKFRYITPAAATVDAWEQSAEEALAGEPSAICMFSPEPGAARAAAARVTQRGVLLVTMGYPLANVKPYATVQVQVADAASKLGASLVDIADGKRSYLLIHPPESDERGTALLNRFMMTASRQSTVQLLEKRAAGPAADEQIDAIRALNDLFPNAGLLVTLSPRAWLETRPELILSPRTRFATLGAAPMLWPYLRSGQAAALVGPVDGEIGYAAVRVALEGLVGADAPSAPHMIACEVVTRQNLESFAARYAEAAGLEAALLPAVTTRPAGTEEAGLHP